MPVVDCSVETVVSQSSRARQVEALFDVPRMEKTRLRWEGDVPFDDEPWSVGLIVGPSGCGKSTIARHLFGDAYHPEFEWGAASVIDDVSPGTPVADIGSAFGSVGFNTIPAWLRPFRVLSNGERFRVDLARRMLELTGVIVVDEFTSVVDRQVAQIGSYAVQKWVRRAGRQFVAVSCHYDIIDWLQPDWILEPATMLFRRRHLQRRPSIDVEIGAVGRDMWRLFAPFHYLTAENPSSARGYCLFVGGRPASYMSVAHFPHPRTKNLKRIARTVTLPDWQGLGLVFVLMERICGGHKAKGSRIRSYPAHPSFVRIFDRSPLWALVKKPGTFGPRPGKTSCGMVNSRPCAVFEYVGPADEEAAKVIQ